MTEKTQVECLFHAACELDSEQRGAFLDAACSEDPSLRREVEAMLRHDEADSGFMAGPAVATPEVTQPVADVSERTGAEIGPYRLMEQIGEGGFGLVFVAQQQKPVRRKVALKIIKPGMDTRDVVARFEAERQALALMDHPNIAKVLDAGTTPSGRPFFVMELIRGIPIVEYCDNEELTTEKRLELFVSVCRAVQHAHSKGVIHRDLKPSNILVSPHDGVPVVKIIDFGIAKAIGGQLTDKTIYTRLTQMIGTPLYMSPEQAEVNALDVDTRSDVYSLGVLLYELLTGTTPFDRERFTKAAYDEIKRIIREEEPPSPSRRLSTLQDTLPTISKQRKTEPAKLTAALKGELDWIVMCCLEKERSRRYQTAAELAADVNRVLTDEPVQVVPPSRIYRAKKIVKRNRLPIGIAIGYVVLSILALLTVMAQRNRTDTLAEEAIAERKAALDAEDRAKRARDREERALQTLRSQLIAWGFDHTLTSESESLADINRLAEYAKLSKDWPLTFQGARALHTGNNPLAREKLEQATTINPDNIAAKSMLAIAYYHDGYLSEWKQLMSTFDAWTPRDEFRSIDQLFLEYARLYSDFDRAAVGLERILEEHGDWHLARVLLAIAYAESAQDNGSIGKLNQAFVEIEIPLQLYPENPFVLMVGQFVHEVGLRLDEHPPGSLLENSSEIVSRLEKHKDYDAGMLMVAGYYDLIGNREKAIEAWQELLDSRAFFLSRAMAELYAEGIDEFDDLILALDPQDSQAIIARAYVLALTPGRDEEAKQILSEQLKTQDASRTVIQHHLLKLMLLMRMPNEAAQQCEKWLRNSSVGGNLDSENLHRRIFQYVADPQFELSPEPDQLQDYFQVNYIKALLEYADNRDEEAMNILKVCNDSRGQSTEHHWARALAKRWRLNAAF